MDNFSNKLHSLFLLTSFFTVYVTTSDIDINGFSLNIIMYSLLFLQMVIITRYFNSKMLISKNLQVKTTKIINKFFIFIFILNWIFISFGTAFFSLVILLLNNGLYLIIINLVKKSKEQEEFKKQFGEDGNYTKADILKTHIVNLFESERDIESITKSDVKRQYRAMAKKYHPDVYKGEQQEKFSSIHLSYKYLMDLKK
ncbi:MAG: DnaJ domain-containing protein [Campylobacterota bacterium]|nr:DnaJ domain-containing protein [Campylobacterota bacterium]